MLGFFAFQGSTAALVTSNGVRTIGRPYGAASLQMNVADDLGIPCEGDCSLPSFPKMPASVHPGVVTGQALVDLLDHAKANGYAIPAVNCAPRRSPTLHTSHDHFAPRPPLRSALRLLTLRRRHLVLGQRVPRGGAQERRAHHHPVLLGWRSVLRR